MQQVSTSEAKPLRFTEAEPTQKFISPSNRIGWLHARADKAGARFDLTIRDAMQRVIFEKRDFGNETDHSGELINVETRPGEEYEMTVENIRGAEHLDVFPN